jgi:ABC-type nickel/cobalt efflux system permease component RcnA
MVRQRRAVELNLVLFIVGIGILAIGIRRRAYPYYPWRKIFGFHSRKHKHHNQHKEDSSQEHEHKHKHKHISGTKNRRIGVTMIISGAVLILAGLIL